ncbi:MAG: hypothetical protein GY857_14730 [Desulfobacula sp.]|nr:hypothetical protein [Desulfobacula sp.]
MIKKMKTKQEQIDNLDLVQERHATGNAPVLVEIICERVHCPMYDYAINTVDMVAEYFGDQIDIQTIVRRGDLKNALRFLKMCKKAGKLLSVPTILVNGDVAFTTVPLPEELKSTIEKHLSLAKSSNSRKDKKC